MRVWGRVHNTDGTRTWQAYETDENGYNDLPNFVWLQNVLLLRTNESPFYANWGIPVVRTLTTSVFPDYYTSLIQQRFSQYFPSCIITRVSVNEPTYQINVVTNTGIKVNQTLSQAET